MKTLLNWIKRFLPHLVIIMGLIFLVFLILDRYNPTMDFTGNVISNYLLYGFCVAAIIQAGLAVYENQKKRK